MKKLHSKFFAIMLLLIFVLSNFSFASLALEVTEEEYLAPYIAIFQQYIEESGIDAQIGDIDLFCQTCKDLSLSEWKNRLDEVFEAFKSISENDEPIVLQRDSNIQFRLPDSGFDDGVPGVSSTISYNSANNGVPGVSSADSSAGYVYLETSSESAEKGVNIEPFSSLCNFYDTFTGYIYSGYKYKTTVSSTIIDEGMSKVFNSATWQAWNFPGEDYFHVSHFENTKINGDTASTDAVGSLKTADGLSLTTKMTMSYRIYAYNYNG